MVIHGANLNMLGRRKRRLYGDMKLEEINARIAEAARAEGVEVECMQSNAEGEIVEAIQKCGGKVDALILNAGAYAHYSLAIRDAVEAAAVPCIEVHLTNIYAREEFRHRSVVAPVAVGQISGFGYLGYVLAIRAAAHLVRGEGG